MPEKARKRLIFCFDGTWNRLAVAVPTNVAMIAQMIDPVGKDGVQQIVHYDAGIGANRTFIPRVLDGMFGWGMLRIIRNAYRFLIFNYAPGDEIYAFGFSRGAFTARSFLGFIRHAGIIDAKHANQIDKAIEIYRKAPAGRTGLESGQALRFRQRNCTATCVSETDREFRMRQDKSLTAEDLPLIDLRYLGVLDTVRALGVPSFIPGAKWLNRRYAFHDAVITSKIHSARHAVALDELRPTFRDTPFGHERLAELHALEVKDAPKPPPPWQLRYQEKWFPGVHGSVGGGGSRRGLSDATLEWVLHGAVKQGLRLRSRQDALTYTLRPRFSEDLDNESAKSFWKRGLLGRIGRIGYSPRKGPRFLDEIALPTFRRWFAPPMSLDDEVEYRPGALDHMAGKMARWPYQNLPEYKSAYVVRRGDGLRKIARNELGDANYDYEIFAANMDRMDDPDSLAVNMVLRIPPVGDRAE